MANVSDTREYTLALRPRTDDSQVGKILKGSISMHVHFDPEPDSPKRLNALETALTAREMGLRGIVLKNHSYPTPPLASLISELVPGIAVFGSICLDYEVGGLNAHAVEAAAKLGAKVVWMPVFSARNSRALVTRLLGIDVKGDGISVLGEDGKIVPEVVDILKIIKAYDMVLATGHISRREILALVDKAKQQGIKKMIVTHVMSNFLSESILKPEEREMLAKEGVFMEHTAWEISPAGGRVNPIDTAAAIEKEGPSNCIMSSDLAQIENPSVAEGMRLFIGSMLSCGLSRKDITYMVKVNPAQLLGLKPEA